MGRGAFLYLTYLQTRPDNSCRLTLEIWKMTETFLRLADVERITGLQRSTIYELAGRGAFPKQVRLSPRAVAWVESEILDWQNARIAERDGVAA